MTPQDLDLYLQSELAAFPGSTSLLVADLATGQIRHAWQPEAQVVSASTIKVPILLAALERVRQGQLSLELPIALPSQAILSDTTVFDRGEDHCSLWELLHWMIAVSDNTATNVILDLLGLSWVNEYADTALGLKHTLCQRKMLDLVAIAAGRNNYTSATDQFQLYRKLYSREILTPPLVETALDLLLRQRTMDGILRYIPARVDFAHKTGELDHISHDAGIFLRESGSYFLGIFTWDGPSPDGDPAQKRYIGRLARAVYETYR